MLPCGSSWSTTCFPTGICGRCWRSKSAKFGGGKVHTLVYVFPFGVSTWRALAEHKESPPTPGGEEAPPVFIWGSYFVVTINVALPALSAWLRPSSSKAQQTVLILQRVCCRVAFLVPLLWSVSFGTSSFRQPWNFAVPFPWETPALPAPAPHAESPDCRRVGVRLLSRVETLLLALS